ncbi:tripartite tricarboxylate transporter TctB family protein [Cellulomonas fimi]|uniref:Tripartite tricarboxylate transporter TctB family protein n=1 Tax=Cellulomonas fimi TaxID=1708 RepID=A0A7Y0LW56_CELFI|nr:tripartite tricarboxylate transporter TctB family protein [Cellulomonas fimi]NMR19055.1 tripartite tricarboxylate transporter TctB family protein [Cellulomonas fimi]
MTADGGARRATPKTPSAPDGRARRHVAWGELVLGVAVLAVGVLVVLDARSLPASTSASGIGAGFFPTIVAVVTMVVAAALIVHVLLGGRGDPDEGEGDVDVDVAHVRSALIVLVAIAWYGLTLERLGYVPTALVTFWAIAYAFGARRYVRDFLISATLAVVIYVGFTKGLSIRLPPGLLEGVL